MQQKPGGLFLICHTVDNIACIFTLVSTTQEQEFSPESAGKEEDLELQLQGLGNTAARLYQFNHAVRQLHHSLSSGLRGKAKKNLLVAANPERLALITLAFQTCKLGHIVL